MKIGLLRGRRKSISSIRSESAVEGCPDVFNPSVFLQFPFFESTLLFNFAFSATNLMILFVIYVLILMVAYPGWVLGLNFVLRLMMLTVLLVEAGFDGFVVLKVWCMLRVFTSLFAAVLSSWCNRYVIKEQVYAALWCFLREMAYYYYFFYSHSW